MFVSDLLEDLGERLDSSFRLLGCLRGTRLRVIAIWRGDVLGDAFPVPSELLEAAAESGLVVDASFALHIEVADFPDELMGGGLMRKYGEHLTFVEVGELGEKYLAFYQAVREGKEDSEKWWRELELREEDLGRVAKWARGIALFDQETGSQMMRLLVRKGA